MIFLNLPNRTRRENPRGENLQRLHSRNAIAIHRRRSEKKGNREARRRRSEKREEVRRERSEKREKEARSERSEKCEKREKKREA